MTVGGTPPTRVIIEADGGSRGNPGKAAFGAVLKDADSGAPIAECAETIGIATNNVAEYRGLISGLELAAAYAPDAEIEVRMDSKLVVEQMSGRWKIKHPDMRPLAMEANRLAPFGTTYTWIPRAENSYADRILNQVLDGKREPGVRVLDAEDEEAVRVVEAESRPEPAVSEATQAARGWAPRTGATVLVLVRHGATALTAERRFSGSTGADPALVAEGRAQMRAAAPIVGRFAAGADAVLVTSPLRRAQESAAALADRLGLGAASVEPDVREVDFGAWEGLTFAEIAERDPDLLARWRSSADEPAPGGESMAQVHARVRAARERLLAEHEGRVVVVVSHVTPIKMLVADAVGADTAAVHRMELAPAAVSVVAHYADGTASLRAFNLTG